MTHTKQFLTTLVLLSGTALAGPVHWKNAQDPAMQTAQISSQPVSSVLRTAAAMHSVDKQQGGYVLVDLSQTPDQSTRERLAKSGIQLLDPVGATTYFARIDGGADPSAFGGHIVGAQTLSRVHKVHPQILADEMPSWSIVGGGSIREINQSGQDPMVAAYVMFHSDVDVASPEINKLVQAHGGRIQSVVMSMNTVVVELPYGRLKVLADDGRVQWVEPPLPPMQTTNASNRALTQADVAQSAPYSLDGTGVTVFVYDGGTILTSHNDFSGRATNIDTDSVSFHATHVAGTIGGDGSTNFNNRGMAPGINLLGAGFEMAGGLAPGFLYTDPGDLESDYALALSLGASIANNSIGSNVASNGYPCSWQGDYGITAGTIDNVIRGSLGDPITIFWAAGNERSGGACGSSYGTTAPPSNNKNSISIGAVNSNNDSMTSFSSWGPSDDGRIRPVIVAPGCQTGGDGGVTSTGDGSNTQYITICGTSMASPTAAGIGALILQDFRVQFPAWGDPSNQLMKAILIQGAEDILNTGPDYQAGYGSIRGVDSIDFMRTGNFEEGVVDQGTSSTFTINVNPGDPEFKVTIVWDDPAGAPNVSPALVNDLDLIVIDPNGVQHFPWTLDPANPNLPAVQNKKDSLNNIEQVQVSNPVVGTWQVQVLGNAVASGPQSFAMVSTLDIGDGLLSIALSEAAPDTILPGVPIGVTAFVNEGVDTLVAGSVEVNYRYSAGAFTTLGMNDNGDGSFSATVPGADCSQVIEYFVSATGVFGGQMYSPPAGANGPTFTEIGETQIVLVDDFEINNGWTVSSNTSDGQWTRGVPVDCSDRGAPGADSDSSGQCWITDNSSANSCNSDVDNGVTTLTSPVFDMTGGGDFSYDYWFNDIPTGALNGDQWLVEVSTDGGSNWTAIRTSTSVLSAWRSDTIAVGQEVAATSTMRFRFSASDVGTQNVIEAGLDNVRITRFVCEDVAACQADFNGDGTLNFVDVSAFVSAFGNSDPLADFNGDGNINFVDVSAFVSAFGAGCP